MDPSVITAVILTRDEERNLPRALTSLPRGIRIFVLDAISRDHTVAFARGAGAQVVQREWTDFMDARRFALAQVGTPWTLMIDADEALDDRLRDAILAAPADGADAYRVRRTTYFSGKPMRIWSNEPLIRLFRTGRAKLEAHPAAASTAAVHATWSCDGDVRELRGTLLHYSYPDVASYRAKHERYTTLEAERMKPSFFGWLIALAAVVPRLAWSLVARGAALDGPRGWYVAYRSATYPEVAARKALLRQG
ncbi:MAG: glycosyltransferase family 2 protein [Candidatus Eremiobacteraeota bacterium]|nr:glycosyltransferase family 2 protein [Candidatus Eremiobacteraeota bacterium]